MTLFRDRADAGQRLAAKLVAFAGRPDVIVLGLPRGVCLARDWFEATLAVQRVEAPHAEL